MICLGIESTAHTLGLGVIDGKRVVENLSATYTTTSGGMIPSKVSDFLVAELPGLLKWQDNRDSFQRLKLILDKERDGRQVKTD